MRDANYTPTAIAGACSSTTGPVSGVFAGCPAATFAIVDLQVGGTMEYRADLTYSTHATVFETDGITLPLACLNTTCAQFSTGAQGDPAISSASCVAFG